MTWISLKDQLPPVNTYVIIHLSNNTKFIDHDDDPNYRIAKLKKYDTIFNNENISFYRFEEFCQAHIFQIEEVDYWCKIERIKK